MSARRRSKDVLSGVRIALEGEKYHAHGVEHGRSYGMIIPLSHSTHPHSSKPRTSTSIVPLLSHSLAPDPTPGRPVPALTPPPHSKERKGDRPMTPVPRVRVSSPIYFPFSCEIELIEIHPPAPRKRRSGPVSWVGRQAPSKVRADRAQGQGVRTNERMEGRTGRGRENRWTARVLLAFRGGVI